MQRSMRFWTMVTAVVLCLAAGCTTAKTLIPEAERQVEPPAYLYNAGLWDTNPKPSLILHDKHSLEYEESVIRILTAAAMLGVPQGAIRFGLSGDPKLPVGTYILPEWNSTILASVLFQVAIEEGLPVQLCYQNKNQRNLAIAFATFLGGTPTQVSINECNQPRNGGMLIQFPEDSPFKGEIPDSPIPLPPNILPKPENKTV